MSKLRETLGLPLDGELTVEDYEAAFEKKPLVAKNLLDTKLSELGEQTKVARKLKEDFDKLDGEYKAYLEANKEPDVDPERVKLEQRINALENEKLRAEAQAKLLNGGVDSDLVEVLISNIKLDKENSDDVINTITGAITTREEQLKQNFLKEGLKVEPPKGGAKGGSSDKTARERFEAVDFGDYKQVEEYIKTYPEEYKKFKNK